MLFVISYYWMFIVFVWSAHDESNINGGNESYKLMLNVWWSCDGSFLTICKNCSLTRSRSSSRCKRTLDRFILLGQAASRSWVTGRAGFERKKRESLAKYGCRDCPMKRHYRIFFLFLFFLLFVAMQLALTYDWLIDRTGKMRW